VSVDDLPTAPLIIDGRARPFDEARAQAVVDPADRTTVVGQVSMGTPADVDAAVAAAVTASSAWGAAAAKDRAAAMLAAAEAVEPGLAERAELLTREHGKTLHESQMDAGGAVKILRYYAGLAERFDTPEVTDDDRGRIVRTRVPYGPTAIIAPWNAPIYLSFLMLAPTLLAGNTVVIKPSEVVPLATVETLRIVAEQLPPGVLNVVPGDADVGRSLANHADVARISFTGSIPTGQALMRAAASTIKGISLELGGNDPALVLEGARITDELVGELVKGVYAGTGQICYNVKRIYVHRTHHDDLVERFCDAVDELVVGNGLDPKTTMGPITTEEQFRSVSGLLDRTRAAGGEVRTLGRKLDPASWDRGRFLLPSVVTDVAPGNEVVTCEQFGPVVPILPFDDVDEAVRLANASEFGLAASVWDQEVDHAFEVAARVDAGTVFVNVHRVGASDVSMEFGGRRQSGFGRGHGYVAVEEASEVKVLAQRADMSAYRP
jgi:aldehyde dehydrogenase